MSAAGTGFAGAGPVAEIPWLGALPLVRARVALARALILFSFVWPFFKYDLVDPGNTTEINFLPVFLAALLVPESSLRDRWSLMLALPVFAVAIAWATPTAPLRLAIGIIPLHIVLNMTRYLRMDGRELIPPNLAYRCLQIFVAFCMVQTVHFNLVAVIPEWLTSALVAIVPRYSEVPYDFSGIRGVQGWATEPSTAALVCMAFAVVAIYQRPDRRWRVLAWFVALLTLNRSIYCMILTILLSLYCLCTIRRKTYAFLAMVPAAGGLLGYIAKSGRMSELLTGLQSDGLNIESNHDLMRFVQILNPLVTFPHIYKPITLYEVWVAEPIGLLPLVAGYGSVLGALWLTYFLWRNILHGEHRSRLLLYSATFVLLIMSPADLIPCVAALAVFACGSHCGSITAIAVRDSERLRHE
jgi:hypothetical protein